MATALTYPTISGVSGAPYISALTDTANVQDTINYFYYGSSKTATDTDGVYGMLKNLQTQISSVQAGINVHESAKMATTGALGTTGNLLGGTITTTYTEVPSPLDASGGRGPGATLTIATSSNWTSITIDGQSLVVNDRVLIKNQTSAIQNGIYLVTSVGAVGNTTSFVFTRADDSDNSIAGEMAEGDFLYVANGTNNANEAYMLTTASATGTGPAGTIKIGTDSVNYTQFIGVGSYYIGTTAAQITSTPQVLTGVSFSDSTSYFVDNADNTKRVNFDVTGTTGITGVLQTAFTTAKTIAFPDTAGTVYVSTGTDVSLADGGTNASLTASNGGIVWSNATQLQILSGTATAGKLLRSGATATPAWSTATFPDTATGTGTILRADGTNWVATTATYPATTTVNNLIYSSATNVIGQVTAPTTNGTYALTSVVSASASVTPTWTTATGTGSPVFSASPTFTGTVIIPTLTSSAAGGTTALSLSTPASTSVTTGGITVKSGDVTTVANTGAGTVTVDTGARTGTGTNTLNLGNTNATAIAIGNANTTTTFSGTANIGKTLIATTTTAAGTSTFTFSSIPQTYKSLEVVYTTTTTQTSVGSVTVTFAGSVAANYQYGYSSQITTSGTYSTLSATSGVNQAGIVLQSTPTSGSGFSFSLDNYTSTTGPKMGRVSGTVAYTGSGMYFGGIGWTLTSTAVTSMTFTIGGTVGSMVVVASLYGVN